VLIKVVCVCVCVGIECARTHRRVWVVVVVGYVYAAVWWHGVA